MKSRKYIHCLHLIFWRAFQEFSVVCLLFYSLCSWLTCCVSFSLLSRCLFSVYLPLHRPAVNRTNDQHMKNYKNDSLRNRTRTSSIHLHLLVTHGLLLYPVLNTHPLMDQEAHKLQIYLNKGQANRQYKGTMLGEWPFLSKWNI